MYLESIVLGRVVGKEGVAFTLPKASKHDDKPPPFKPPRVPNLQYYEAP